MWDISLKTTNENNKNKQKFTDTDNSVVVTKGKRDGRLVKGNGCQICGDQKRFDFRLWACNAI